MSYEEKLIAYFVKYRGQELSKLPEFKSFCKKHDHSLDFKRSFLILSNHRKELKKYILDKEYLSRSKQVANCLRLFRKAQNNGAQGAPGSPNDHAELLAKLVKGLFYNGWSDNQIDYFQKTCLYFSKKYDYFLSFTNRVFTGDRKMENPVNKEYHAYIRHAIKEDYRGRNDNGLAKCLNRYLSIGRLRGFYYPEHQYDNESVLQKLESAGDSCRNFVQVIQKLMFDPPREGDQNFCFIEYEVAKRNAPPTKFIFVRALPSEGKLEPIDVPIEYADWLEHVLDQDVVPLPEITEFSIKKCKEQDNRVREQIVDKIKKNYEEIYDSVPQ